MFIFERATTERRELSEAPAWKASAAPTSATTSERRAIVPLRAGLEQSAVWFEEGQGGAERAASGRLREMYVMRIDSVTRLRSRNLVFCVCYVSQKVSA